MKKKRPPMEFTVAGYVRATDWDLNDMVNEISIETGDEDYVVAQNDLAEELFKLLDREVEVTGIVKENREGIKWITPTSYEVLSETDDEEDEYDGLDDSDLLDLESEQGESTN
jgi:hypothetical protein